MEINNKTFSLNLIKIRKKKGLSQKDLAEISGISPRMIAHYEKHVTYPPIEKIYIIAKALNVDISEILGISNTKEEFSQNDFDIRSLKKFKKILLLNPHDRSSVYKYIDSLLQNDEYKNEKQLQESPQ